jgi:outer membrane protein insertion porin family
MNSASKNPASRNNFKKSLKKLLVTASVVSICFANNAFAQKVNKIVVKGNARTETSTVISFLGIDIGKTIDSEDINKAVSNLYESGLFKDVKISLQKSELVVSVVENSVVKEVVFEGNKKIKSEDLQKELLLSPRTVFSESALQKDVKRIVSVYAKVGRFSAEVKPKVINQTQNRVVIVYQIKENSVAKISKITFIGNKDYDSSVLKREISSKQKSILRLLSSDDVYDPDRVDYDIELLRRFYFSNGYADFKVVNKTAEQSPVNDNFNIVFTVSEGPKYRFGDVSVKSEFKSLDITSLDKSIESKKSDTFNADKVNATIKAMTAKLSEKGFAFVDVQADYKTNKENNTLDVVYIIKEGPKVYVNQVNIKGNTRTIDSIIRRQILLAEGDSFNSQKLKDSEKNINNLGYFKKVKVDTEKTENPDQVDVNVDVAERSTGSLNFGAGYSTSGGAFGQVSLLERNLIGTGKTIRSKVAVSQLTNDVDFGISDPYFLDYDLTAGLDLFYQDRKNNNTSLSDRTFENNTLGASFNVGYELTDLLTHVMKYTYRRDDVKNVSDNASIYIKEQKGKNTSSYVTSSLIYDRRDNKFKPTEGTYLRYDLDLAGLGGDSKYIKNRGRATQYVPIYKKDLILKVTGTAGDIRGYNGEKVKITDRFFLDENDVRGFRNDGLGPRDAVTGDPLGGNTYYTASTDLLFPLKFLPEEMDLTGSIFFDTGTLYGIDPLTTSTNPIFDEKNLRSSYGAGLGWNSPVGPINIYYAEPLNEKKPDKTRKFTLSFGTNF